ncbi:MAG TPA: asparagine synthase (glutamine-hydrolyzing) [Vicinamibacterales bacterium]|nr:asparagine synthase (glutamine-hydrolyzing) [Vicinamibacterales bacterium]
MCGIAGILTANGGASGLADRAGLMEAALAHRGPDGRGAWISRRESAVFTHRRLAIIDPSPAGRQPMSIDDGRLTITFNGEIYNFMELRRELEARGAVFQSGADTEVILRAYDAFGERCVERLRGMFAFALWDERAQLCLLARDRFGIKPLYYSHDRERLVFASELRALCASGLVPQAVDATAVYEYLRAGSVPEPMTLLAGARCLEAGHLAIWSAGELQRRPYFDLSFEPAITPDDAPARTRDALIDSVQHHFVGDVPVGIFLSGGVDSTALLAIASRLDGIETRAMTMALPDTDANEVQLARRTADHFGVRHDVCEVSAGSARPLFDEYIRVMDQPSIDGMNTLAVSKLAQSHGMKVMLSGVGADELFGGYPSVRAVATFTAWNRRLASAGALRRVTGKVLEAMPDPRWRRIGDLLGRPPALSASYEAFRGIFTRAEARTLTQHLVPGGTIATQDVETAEQDPTPEDAVCRLEMTRYMRNQLLRDADAMSMAHGVEVRLPYLDSRFVETVTAIPAGERLSASKSLLVSAVPEIPAWVASQPKRGFMFPVESWLSGTWQGVFDETDARTPVPLRTWYRKWCVHALESWLRRMRDTAPRPSAAVIGAGRGVHG